MSHRSIVDWNQWLRAGLGQLVLQAEQGVVKCYAADKFGKHALLIGVPHQNSLLISLEIIPFHLLLTPLQPTQEAGMKSIQSHLYELPIASGSVDMVILPHTLELVDNPRQLLAEACRIVKPEGHLIISGFNPYSLWGIIKISRRKNGVIPDLNFLKYKTVRQWLKLSDFELVKHSTVLYAPPIKNQQLVKKLQFLEWLGNKCHLPWGAVYIMMARAKVIPLTPIRLRWKQSLATLPIPTRIPGPTVRNID